MPFMNPRSSRLPVVAIIGRPNVGKSALFNRLTGRRHSIVFDQPGVTRDRIYGECEWSGRSFTLIDTGGMDPNSEDLLRQQVFEQARKALQDADLLIVVVDCQAGPHPLDFELASLLRKSGKPLILTVNKAESPTAEHERYQFYQLGLGDPIPVSAIHGSNSGDLLDEVLAKLPEKSPVIEDEAEVSIALVGRPNVGKSSILNCLVGEERSLVHHEAGTTRDTVDTLLEHDGRIVRLVDTAGLRKRTKVEDDIEYYSGLRAVQALERAQVGILVLDASQPIATQDQRVGGEIQKAGIASVVVVNKWDLARSKKGAEADSQVRIRGNKVLPARGADKPASKAEKLVAEREWIEQVAQKLDFIAYSSVIFVSALTGEETPDILSAALDAHEQWSRRIDTSTLNLVVREAVALKPPPSYKGQSLKVLYVTQQKTQPPTVIVKVNNTKLLHFSYERYLENQLRDAFGFVGTPLHLRFER